METILPEELDQLFPSSEDEKGSDEELTHVLQKARKYGGNGHRGQRKDSNVSKRKNKYERYLHAAGALLAKKAGGDAGQAVGGRYGAAAGRLVAMYTTNPGKFGDSPERLVHAAVGRPRRKRPRRRGGRHNRQRGGRNRRCRQNQRRGRGRRGGNHAHRGIGSADGAHGGGDAGGGAGSGEDADDGDSTDSTTTSSDWE